METDTADVLLFKQLQAAVVALASHTQDEQHKALRLFGRYVRYDTEPNEYYAVQRMLNAILYSSK